MVDEERARQIELENAARIERYRHREETENKLAAEQEASRRAAIATERARRAAEPEKPFTEPGVQRLPSQSQRRRQPSFQEELTHRIHTDPAQKAMRSARFEDAQREAHAKKLERERLREAALEKTKTKEHGKAEAVRHQPSPVHATLADFVELST